MSEWMISSSVLIISVIAIRYFFRERLSMRVRYALWLLVAVRLLVPLSFAESGFSVLNLVAFQEEGEAQREQKEETAPGAAFALSQGAVSLDGQSPESLPGSLQSSTADGQPGGETEREAVRQQEAACQQSAQSDSGAGQRPDGQDGRGFRKNMQPVGGAGQKPDGQDGRDSRENIQSYGESEQMPERRGESGAAPASAWRKALAGVPVLFYVWLAGVALFSCILIGMNRQYRRRIYRSRQRFYADTVSRLPIYVSPMVEAPCMFGLFHPAVYLNPRVAKEGQSLRYILAHENTHYRHGDNLWVLVRAACVCFHWYNPLLWLAACLSRQDG